MQSERKWKVHSPEQTIDEVDADSSCKSCVINGPDDDCSKSEDLNEFASVSENIQVLERTISGTKIPLDGSVINRFACRGYTAQVASFNHPGVYVMDTRHTHEVVVGEGSCCSGGKELCSRSRICLLRL